ncbi:MAG: substrate-binding domain-containing protein [Bacteroidia bacterium]
MRAFRAFFFLVLAFYLFTFCEQQSTTSSSESPSRENNYKSQPSTSPNAQENVTKGEIYIAVDESLLPIIQAELDNFQAVYDGAIIHPIVLPGEEAIRAMLVSDSIRLVITGRKLNREEEYLLESLTIPPDYATLGKDGVALVVNPKNTVNQLQTSQLTGILSGEIKSWKKIDPGSPLDNVSLIFDNARSTTISFLRDSLMEGKSFSPTGTFAMKNTTEVIDYVAENPGSIGLVGMSWLSDKDDPKVQERLKKVRVVFLEKLADSDIPCAYTQQYFGPYQSFLDQECYPLTRKIYSISRESGIGLGTGLVAYIDGPQGQKIIHKSGLAAIHTIPRKIKLPEEEPNTTTARQKPPTTKENSPDTGKK